MKPRLDGYNLYGIDQKVKWYGWLGLEGLAIRDIIPPDIMELIDDITSSDIMEIIDNNISPEIMELIDNTISLDIMLWQFFPYYLYEYRISYVQHLFDIKPWYNNITWWK